MHGLLCARLPLAGKHVVVAEWDTCLYIIRADLVVEHAQHPERVRWMSFCEADTGFTCVWAKPAEAQVCLVSASWAAPSKPYSAATREQRRGLPVSAGCT